MQRVTTRTKKTSVACIETHNNAHILKLLKRKMSDPDIHHPPPETHALIPAAARSAAISIPHRAESVENNDSNEEANGMYTIIILFKIFQIIKIECYIYIYLCIYI